MTQAMITEEPDKSVDMLKKHTISWFIHHKKKDPAQLFYLYLVESTSGHFQHEYAHILSNAMPCYTEIFWQLTNQLSDGVSQAIPLPVLKTRRIFGMIIYWLFHHYNGQESGIPEKEDALDIFTGILKNHVLKLW